MPQMPKRQGQKENVGLRDQERVEIRIGLRIRRMRELFQPQLWFLPLSFIHLKRIGFHGTDQSRH